MADWMQTHTGRAFYPMEPDPNTIDPADIAHALGMICRYGGHTRYFYSVAEHCVLMSKAVEPQWAAHALLHDATETYVGDMIRPLKRSMTAYRKAEDKVARAVATRFRLTGELYPAAVKNADNRILLDERAAVLGPPPQPWAPELEALEPLGVTIRCWNPERSGREYLHRMVQLGLTG
jgi:hypothetical protein